MKTYTVRPYHGYDCNSDSGFNDGCYLSAITVRAANPKQARIRAMARWRRTEGNYTLLKEARAHDSDFYNSGDSFGFYTESGPEDRDGNTVDPTDDVECFYSYQFVSFDDVSEGREL